MFDKIFLILLIACCLHHVIFWIDAEKIIFELAMMSLIAPYTVFVFIGGIFGSIYLSKARKAKIARTGIDARAIIESAKDTQIRYNDGAHLTYKMKLTLRIEDHPKSPYTITGDFWISEFYIHLITSGKPLSVKVDKKDHTKVSLNLN